MNKPTFRQSYDKIVSAYMSCTLEPYNSCACFIGNMLNNNPDWEECRVLKGAVLGNGVVKPSYYFSMSDLMGYTPEEIVRLENNFLNTLQGNVRRTIFSRINNISEQALFEAMQSTLLLLKEIHEAAGEVITDDPSEEFTKRPEPCA